MAEPLTFSQCLNRLMQKHRLSLSDLSGMINSRADLRHILADDATPTKRSRVFAKLKDLCLFDDADYKELERSLEISRLGAERYRFQQAIADILTGTHRPDGEIYTDSGATLTQRFQEFEKLQNIEIVCFNSCYHSLIAAINQLFNDPDRNISMRHYVQSDAHWNIAAEYVSAVLPILFDHRYTAYLRNPDAHTKVPVLGGNLLLLRAQQGNTLYEAVFIFLDSHTAHELPNASACQLFSFVDKILQSVQPPPVPLKEESPYKLDFPSLCMTFLSHELNRATYCIFNDLCFQQTPTDIALTAFKDKGFVSSEETARIISRTLSIHEQRYQNQYRKKKPTYRIMTKKGCKQFLSTGMSTDHFIGFRAFTPEERKVIFGNMLDAARKNSFFIPLLLKDDTFEHSYNLVCYDKLGVSIDAKDTNYDISDGYRSVFLQFPDFTQQYRDYYLDILVGEKCHSRQESLKLLENMFQDFLHEYGLQET